MSTAIVVDTNVVSFLFKRSPQAAEYAALIAGKAQLISFQTIAEFDHGALKANWGQRRVESLELYLEQFTVIPYTRGLARAWAKAKVLSQSNGRAIDPADAWIAATALLYGVPLITDNVKDFKGVTDLEIITATRD
jgi:tRNA(fMet)-specific endonuclease VapC